MAAGVVLLLAMLFDQALLSFYLLIGIVAVLVLSLFAGFTNPLSYSVIVTDAIVSAAGFLLFEYLAVLQYADVQNFSDIVFLLRQALAVIFFIAIYFATKTLRGARKTRTK